MPAPKSLEFSRRAVELAGLPEKPVAQFAEDLGIGQSGLRRWIAQADVEEGRPEGLPSDERREPAELRRTNRVLKLEVEILMRASAYSVHSRLPHRRRPRTAYRTGRPTESAA